MQKEFPNRDIGNLFMDTHFGSTSDNPDNPLSLRPLSLSPSHARFVSPYKIDTSRYIFDTKTIIDTKTIAQESVSRQRELLTR